MLFNLIKISGSTSSGTLSGTFTSCGELQQIFIKPTTATTQYDFRITDADGLNIYHTTAEIGTLNDLLTLPLSGGYSWTIENATADEAFDGKIGVRNM
jgi:hypothetical protein